MLEKGTEWKVLDKGLIKFLDVMGDDQAIVDAARLSYGKGTRKTSDDRHLVRYLMRHSHTSPLEQAELKFLIKCPIYIWRQWIRHRASKFSNINEYSGRYSEMIDECEQTKPEEWRLQSDTNKQGSKVGKFEWPDGYRVEYPGGGYNIGVSPEVHLSQVEEKFQREAREVYESRLKLGVAREQARKDLPLSNFTLFVWKIDLHNLLHFLSLRMDAHAQQEIREYASVIGKEIVAPLFPHVWEAFNDYKLNSISLTGLDIEMINNIQEEPTSNYIKDALWFINGVKFGWLDKNFNGEVKVSRSREREEFEVKATKLGIGVPWL